MKILHVYKDYHPVLGGIENYVKLLAEGQAAAGHDVTVLVCDPGRRTRIETRNGVRVIKAGRLATSASMPLSLSLPLRLALQKPDVIHVESPFPLGEAANWILGRGRVTIITYHSDVVRQKKWLRFYGPILKRVLKAADRIIVDSPAHMSGSTWLEPVRDKCVAVPIGVDTERFKPASPTRSGPFEILFVGRLRYYKGLDTALHAMTLLPDAHLSIVGEGSMFQEWQALSRALRLEDRVTFEGSVPDVHLSGRYQEADLFILPSNARSEAYGIVLLEAMASGLPCVTTELGTGTSWLVQHGATGLVVPPEDPLALAEAIAGLQYDADRRQAMGAAGRERVEEHFTTRHTVEGVEEVYRQALASRSR